MNELKANPEKQKTIEIYWNGEKSTFDRLPLKTHIITNKDNLIEVVEKYAVPYLNNDDILFITERIVACTQNRAIPVNEIKPRLLAKILCKFVHKTPYGIGLGIPETMEMALVECGTMNIIVAALISVIGKIFGKRGWFYHIAGEKARAIDGPCDNTIPPYNEYVVLAPNDADQVACNIAKSIGVDVIITDINDLGGNILGASSSLLNKDMLISILKDNPLGQCDEQTPMGIIRKCENNKIKEHA